MFKFLRRLFSGVPSPVDPRVEAALADDDDMAWFFPPAEVHAAEPWDRYWTAQLENGLGPPLFEMFCDDEVLLEAMHARGLRTVLCVGSGITREPHALALAGFEVTALDISPFAIQFASGIEPGNVEPERFFNPNRTRPGGTATFVVGDLIDPAVCPGPFDVVIERKTLQLFPDSERAAALRAVVGRLSQRGILLTHCHDGSWRPPEMPTHAIEPLLGDAGLRIHHHGASPPSDGRLAIVVRSTG